MSKTAKIDWGKVAGATPPTRSGAAPGGGGAPGGLGRITLLVSCKPCDPEDSPDFGILTTAYGLKRRFTAVGINLTARAFTAAEQRDDVFLDKMARLGVTDLPAAVVTLGGERTVASGRRASERLLASTLAAAPGAAAPGAAAPGAAADTSVEAFYDRELRSKSAWTAATSGADESEEINGGEGDLNSEMQKMRRRRKEGEDSERPAVVEQVVTKAAPTNIEDASPAMSAAAGGEVRDAVAAVSDGSVDDALMASYWENNTETIV